MSLPRRVLGGLLVFSLGANLFFALRFAGESQSGGRPPSANATLAASADPEANKATSAHSTPPPPAPTPEAEADQPRRVRDALRAAGLNDEAIRALMEQWLWRRQMAEKGTARPWWQASALSSDFSYPDPANLKAVKKELAALFGETAPRNARLDFLPEEKRAAVTRILADYEALSADFQIEANSFSMPEDQKRIALLKTELENDLRHVLTASEYEELTLLQTSAAQRAQLIAQQLALDEPTFREVLRLRREIEARQKTTTPPTTAQINAEEARFEAELAALIGAEPLRKAYLLNSTDAKVLRRAQQRLAFDDATFDRVLEQRERVAEAVTRITASAAPADEKRAALKAEAARVKAQIADLLGADAAQAYFEQNGMSWLRELERGQGLRFDPRGWTESVNIR